MLARRINKAIVLLFLIISSLFVLYPIVYIVSAAFTPGYTIAGLSIIPFGGGITLDHFRYLFAETDYVLWFKNTLIIAAATSLSTVAVCSVGAYVFSRFRFTFKKGMMMAMLVLQIFPSFVGMVAVYGVLMRVGGLDTLWGLVLVYVAGNIPYNVWLVKSYIDSIPRSLDEAASIDGASHFRVFATIILPIATPIIRFLAITSFTGPWMDFILPRLVLRSGNTQTLALGLFSFVSEKTSQKFTVFAAGSLVVAVPFIIMFVFTQKAMVTSLGGAAVKE